MSDANRVAPAGSSSGSRSDTKPLAAPLCETAPDWKLFPIQNHLAVFVADRPGTTGHGRLMFQRAPAARVTGSSCKKKNTVDGLDEVAGFFGYFVMCFMCCHAELDDFEANQSRGQYQVGEPLVQGRCKHREIDLKNIYLLLLAKMLPKEHNLCEGLWGYRVHCPMSETEIVPCLYLPPSESGCKAWFKNQKGRE